MTLFHFQDEQCPVDTLHPDDVLHFGASSPPPLLRQRRNERFIILPEHCRLSDRCLACQWRRQGQLDAPDPVSKHQSDDIR